MFSTQVTVILHKQEEITSLKESEEYARNIVMSKFEIEIRKFINILSEVITSKKLRQVPGIASDSCKVGHIVWLHTIFYFDKKELFREDTKVVLGELKEDVIRQLSLLLEQVPEDISPIVDRYVFYGWGRSLIVTKATVNRSEIKKLVELLEIFQYFCFGLYQLDTFLIRKMYELNPLNNQDESVGNLDEQLKRLRSMIQRIENVRSSTIRYLEQFRYSSNVVLISGERPLIQKLEDQWDLEHIEDSIRSKLELLNRDLKSQEQALLAKQQVLISDKQDEFTKEQRLFTEEQRYLNKLILLLTLVTFASVMAQLVLLSPLNETFPEKTENLIQSQLFIVLLVSGFK
jgi:hypothetical protein